RMDASGALTTLHAFTGGRDGAYPAAALIQASDGNFYGTTSGGGASYAGTLFRMDASGTLTTLHAFTGGSDGGAPGAALIQASDDGNFYGTTPSGGASLAGTIFKIDASGALTTQYAFTGGSDGGSPGAALIHALDGN